MSRYRVGDGEFMLSVGRTNVTFEERSVVINSFTWHCGNDWFAMGSFKSMVVTRTYVCPYVRPYVQSF